MGIAYILEALENKKKRIFFFLFIFLLLFSAFLDSLNIPTIEYLRELFMAIGFSGVSICLGTFLHSTAPTDDFKYQLFGTVWILAGIGTILAYVAIKIINLILAA